LLSRAESYVQLNQLSLAYADLQYFVNKRYNGNPSVTQNVLRNHYSSTNDKLNALSFIVEERRKEFMHEGLRWFDIKRFNIPVTHDDATGSTVFLEGEDDRKVLQIPQAAIDVGGLEPNPR
jgi:hypothetical protein